MKILKLLLACCCLPLCTPPLLAQQPVNESQTQADRDRQNPPHPGLYAPPVHILHFNSKREAIAATLEVLPGQKLEIGNDIFTWIRVFSDRPFSINVGTGCQSLSTLDMTCEIMPNVTIRIRDTRIGTSPDSAPLAHLHITALKHTP